MVTADGFEMLGYFRQGKTQSLGRFTAPNGDKFYGCWNEKYHREGAGLFIKGDEDKQLIEIYTDGELKKRIRMARKLSNTMYWLPTPPVEFGCGSPAAAPCPRHGHSMVLSGPPDHPRLVLFGGQTIGEDGRALLLDDLWVLDIHTMVWSRPATRGTGPPPLHSHASVAVGRVMYVIGGADDGALGANRQLFALDMEAMTWYAVPTRGESPGFVGHTATLVKDCVWVVWGRSVWRLSLRSHEWAEMRVNYEMRCAPRALTGHAAVALGSLIYVLGGETGTATGARGEWPVCSAEVRVFDTESQRWGLLRPSTAPGAGENFSPPPSYRPAGDASDPRAWRGLEDTGVTHGGVAVARSGLTACAVSATEIVVVGGMASLNPDINEINTSYLADVLVLDVQANRWSAPWIKYPVCAPRAGHAAVCVGGFVWVTGGTNHAVGERGMWELALLHVGEDARNKSG
jgi:hypothetical protein